jgi:hypothetical protein
MTPRITIAALLPVDGDGDDAGIAGVCEEEEGDGQEGRAPHDGE